MLSNIIIKPLTHRGGEHYALFFSYDKKLVDQAKKAGCRFSFQNKCWYLPATKENLHKLFTVFKGVAWLDTKAIKHNSGIAKPVEKKNRVSVAEPLPDARLAELEKLKEWMQHKHYSERTIKVYLDCVRLYFSVNRDKDPHAINREDFISFIREHIIARKLSFTYQNQFVNALKLFLQMVYGLHVNTDFLERPRREHKLPNVLSKQEVLSILKHTDNIKHNLMLRLAYGCGLRVGEVLALRVDDIDRMRRCIQIRLAKGFKDRVVPLPISVEPILNMYIERYQPKYYLFEGEKPNSKYTERSLQLVLKKSVTLSGITKPVTMHWLRHSYATHMLESGVDTRFIQVLLGHKNIKTTEIYTHVSTHQINAISSPIDSLNL
ncbi:MAG TPA: tyrosine-type recombinase/integrase [Chitinophagales bacterium]|nr:tyrosine-type recombinase/integrase [Chitinophagales bacterium]HMZ89004.1 tyrosine-type recombinase/integrase [Chitinophagales bacterium]HNE45973.1 tyrosine-type recombinase/integrase [Chitinophagales bacterium]HNF69727.1 tyrosine-type recombinase/integrase [Chitinophagales bacterium]HNI54636.1 tyrosine-type recombinase/integrase [Chitinophagales bacterium]